MVDITSRRCGAPSDEMRLKVPDRVRTGDFLAACFCPRFGFAEQLLLRCGGNAGMSFNFAA